MAFTIKYIKKALSLALKYAGTINGADQGMVVKVLRNILTTFEAMSLEYSVSQEE